MAMTGDKRGAIAAGLGLLGLVVIAAVFIEKKK